MHQIWALARKDLLLLCRDKSGLFFTFVFPIGFALFFGMIFGGSGPGSARIAIAVVDADKSEQSGRFVQRLTDAEQLTIHTPPVPGEGGAGVEALEWARKLVLSRAVVAYVFIQPGFGKAHEEMFFGGQGQVQVGADPSKKAERGMLEGILQQHVYAGLGDAMAKPEQGRRKAQKAMEMARQSKDLSPADRLVFETFFGALDVFLARAERAGQVEKKAAEGDEKPPASARGFAFAPVAITFADVQPSRTGPCNAFAVSFPQGLVWGVMGTAMGFAVSFIGERRSGVFARLACAPMPPWRLIAGKALACMLTIVFAMCLMLSMSAALGVRLGNWPTLVVGGGVVAFAFVGIMAIISVFAPTERAATGLGWAVMMVLAFIGGAAVPTFVMPGWMQTISNISPMAWALACLEGGVWRGSTIGEIAKPLVALGTLGVLGLGVAVAWLRHVR
jgi:ABC-2 type transport system permease protein